MNNQEEEKLENQIVENQNESPEVAENVENLGENLDSAETKTEGISGASIVIVSNNASNFLNFI